jgi:hypothetical protein
MDGVAPRCSSECGTAAAQAATIERPSATPESLKTDVRSRTLRAMSRPQSLAEGAAVSLAGDRPFARSTNSSTTSIATAARCGSMPRQGIAGAGVDRPAAALPDDGAAVLPAVAGTATGLPLLREPGRLPSTARLHAQRAVATGALPASAVIHFPPEAAGIMLFCRRHLFSAGGGQNSVYSAGASLNSAFSKGCRPDQARHAPHAAPQLREASTSPLQIHSLPIATCDLEQSP